jgi:hypothetical protein
MTARIISDAWPRSHEPVRARLDRQRSIGPNLSALELRLNARRQQRAHERLTAPRGRPAALGCAMTHRLVAADTEARRDVGRDQRRPVVH